MLSSGIGISPNFVVSLQVHNPIPMASPHKLKFSAILKQLTPIDAGLANAKLFPEVLIAFRIVFLNEFEVNFLFIVVLQNAYSKLFLSGPPGDL